MISKAKAWYLIAAAIAIVAAPLLLPLDGAFKGSDDLGTQAITAAHPDYRPWFEPLWTPPSSEIESLLFALQAALGAGSWAMPSAAAREPKTPMSPVDRAAHQRPLAPPSARRKGPFRLGHAADRQPPAAPADGARGAGGDEPRHLGRGSRTHRLWLASIGGPIGFLLVGVLSVLLQVDHGGIRLAPDGPAAAAALAARALAGLSCLLFLALTTPVTDLLTGLRRLRLPAEIADIALLIYRFLFLLADTAMAMDSAQAARLGHDGTGRRLRSLGQLIGNLLPRALDRARRLEVGLAARGYDGEMRVLSPRRPPTLHGLARVLAVPSRPARWPLEHCCHDALAAGP